MISGPLSDSPGSSGSSDDRPTLPMRRYTLLGRIATGSIGTVYVGTSEGDTDVPVLVAIKVIHEHLAENRMFVHLMLEETARARQINHPHAIGISDVGDLDGKHFVVSPYCEGQSLAELARLHGQRLSISLVTRVLIDALNGLHAAHAASDAKNRPLRIVHGDLSPSNILVGADGLTRVIDFGVARAASRMATTAPSTGVGAFKGKTSYMAPEQALGEKVDHRADVFSAGVVLWTLLTGQRLFTGENSAQTLQNLMNAEIPPPSKIRPQVAKGIDDVCLRALERRPDRRFQSAAEMAEELYTAAIIAQNLASPRDVSTWVRETLGPRLDRRTKLIEERKATRGQYAGELNWLRSDVGDLDSEPAAGNAPVTASAQPRAKTPAPIAVRAESRPGKVQTAQPGGVHMPQWPRWFVAGALVFLVLAALAGLLLRGQL